MNDNEFALGPYEALALLACNRKRLLGEPFLRFACPGANYNPCGNDTSSEEFFDYSIVVDRDVEDTVKVTYRRSTEFAALTGVVSGFLPEELDV